MSQSVGLVNLKANIVYKPVNSSNNIISESCNWENRKSRKDRRSEKSKECKKKQNKNKNNSLVSTRQINWDRFKRKENNDCDDSSVSFSVSCFTIKCMRSGFCHCGTLNGSNGECTNADDVDNAARGFDHRSRERVRREAQTNRHHTGGSNRKNMGFGPPIKQEEVEPIKVSNGIIDRSTLVELPGCDYLFDGLKFYHRVDNHFECDGVVPASVVLDGHRMVGDFSLGYVKRGPFDGYARSAFRRETIRATEVCGVIQPGLDGLVFVPGLNMLSEKLPCNGKPNFNRVRVATGMLQKTFIGLPKMYIKMTVDYWCRNELDVKHDIESTRNLRLFSEGEVSEYDSVMLPLARNLRLSVCIDTHYKIFGEECLLSKTWLPKNIYTLKGVGVDFDMATFFELGSGICDIRYPRFLTQRDVNETPKYSKTVMFSFSGSNANFTIYDVSANNAEQALKRLLAARDGEDDLYEQQLSILYGLSCDGLINPKVLRKLKIDMQCHDGTVRWIIGKGEKSHHVRFKHVPLSSTIKTGWLAMVNRCTRSTVDEILDGYKNTQNWLYYAAYNQWLEFSEAQLGREVCADLQHVKRNLRREYVKGVELHSTDDIMVERLSAKVKREVAKVGKVPRLFVSYEAGCMYANELPEWLKVALSKTFVFPKGKLWKYGRVRIMIMSKMRDNSFEEVFEALMSACSDRNEIVIAIYSDDAVYAGNIDGKPFGKNVDISSCDAGNNSLAFSLVGTLISKFSEDRALGLLSQCMLPITLLNPNNVKEFLKIEFHSAFEGSGTVLTTILNHVISYMIAISFIDKINNHNYIDMDIEALIVAGAGQVGHRVTVESWCDKVPCYEKIQFLKKSPIRTMCGKWVVSQNYGCIFRSFGSVEGDMESKHLNMDDNKFKMTPWEDRLEIFASSVVRGYVHEPQSIIMDALRARFNKSGTFVNCEKFTESVCGEQTTELNSECFISGCDRANVVLDPISICTRYDIGEADLHELSSHILNIQLGEDSVTDAVTGFFLVDYGVV